MLKRYLLLVTLLWMTVSTAVYAYDWTANPGDGTEANPYQISEPNHLLAINEIDTAGRYFVMTSDIDLDPNLPGNRVFETAVIAPETSSSFEGSFDGNGHTIQNMQIIVSKGSRYLGLFGKIESSGMIKNLTLSNFIIQTNLDVFNVGGLAGQNLGAIINCAVNGCLEPAVEGRYEGFQVGGLVGINGDGDYYDGSQNDYRAFIANSKSYVTIRYALGVAGGLAGSNYGSIYQCFYQGKVYASSAIGGLVGDNCGVVNRSFSNAEVRSIDGGGYLVGGNLGLVRNCYALGNTPGTTVGVSGLIGVNSTYLDQLFPRVENCYAACLLEGNAYGLIGPFYMFAGAALSSFWDAEISQTTESDGGKGLPTAQMKDPNTFIKAGWDMVGESANGLEDIWQIDPNINSGYPSLVFRPIDGGDGTPENPYIIYTKQQLLDVFNDPAMWDRHVKLIANIDLSDTVFTSAPIQTFNGTFDGSGCIIDGLTVQTGCTSLIETVSRSGQVKNLYIKNAAMSNGDGGILATTNLGKISDCHVQGTVGENMHAAGLVSFSDGLIYRCSADCQTDGWFSAGGLVAENGFSGVIQESYSNGSIAPSGYSGGLVAQNYGKIEHSYANVSVTGSGNTGALVGSNELGVVICCYATGSVEDDKLVGFNAGGVVAHCYYGRVDYLEAWEGNSWYEEDGYIWTVSSEFHDDRFPRLKWQQWGIPVTVQSPTVGYIPPYRQDPTRDGSAEHPYLFSFELTNFPADWDKHFVLTADIDMMMVGYPDSHNPVIPSFDGTLDGDGHVIKNLFFENNDDIQSMGFFGRLGCNAYIKRLGIQGELSYSGWYPALFAGVNFGTLEECYAKGAVTCSGGGGVLTGFNGGTIRNCYAEGRLTLQDAQTYRGIIGGGLYARSWGRVLNSYASVETDYPVDHIYSGVGGLNEGLVWNSYWNNDLTDPNFSMGGSPLTTAEMKDADNFTGWGDNIWKIAEGFDLPRLAWENTDWTPDTWIPIEDWPWDEWPQYPPIVDTPRTYGGGEGTAQSPYVLTTSDHLFTLGKHLSDCDKYFVLGNDIDLSNQILSEAVIAYFSGHFNGKGHAIHGLSIEGINHSVPLYGTFTSSLGLFGCIDKGGIVENLALTNVDIDGMCTIGALAGENYGTIRRSYATGNIAAEGNVGGLVGSSGFRRPYGSAQIEDCYTDADVSGNTLQGFAANYLGGLVGANNGLISRCHAAGSIHSEDYIPAFSPFILGGIAGWSHGGPIENCYYLDGNKDIYAQQLTGSQMKQRDNFVSWDFVGDGNGNRDIWRMCADGVDYPRLSWEFSTGGDFTCPAGVNLRDFAALAANWQTSAQTQPETFNIACDGNLDDTIDLNDLMILADNWLKDM